MYSREEVEKIVQDAVIETFDYKGEITNNDLSFKEDLEADSIGMLSLALVLEEDFSAEIDEDKIGDFLTINNVIDYILKIQEKNNA